MLLTTEGSGGSCSDHFGVTTTTVVLRTRGGSNDSANYMAGNASSVIELPIPQTPSSADENATCGRPSEQTLGA